jgi:hypothetical protein
MLDRAPKWRQAIDIVAALTAELERSSQFHIIAYRDEARPLLAGTEGEWLPAANRSLVEQAMQSLRSEAAPDGRSNLHAAFTAAAALRPAADTIYLVTDGLPTAGPLGSERRSDERQRRSRLELAAAQGPSAARINVILLPLEGDLTAAPAYWELALRTGGSLLAPTEDASTDAILGVPLDSKYLVFVVDTSGSMRQFAWADVGNHLVETISAYPFLEGIQIIDGQGRFLFHEFRNGWIPASPEQMAAALDALEVWRRFSDSDPREGVMAAIDFLSAHEKENAAIYVYGDDLAAGGSPRAVERFLTSVGEENRDDAGARKARIHAVAFPVYYEELGVLLTAANYAVLMRELAQRNGGSFIALPSGWTASFAVIQ